MPRSIPNLLDLDNPWRRLPWSLPLALVISAGILWEFGRILERAPVYRTVPASIEAELVELPPPSAVEQVRREPERPKPAPQPAKIPTPVSTVPLIAAPSAPASEDKTPVPTGSPPPPVQTQPAARPAPDTRSAGTATMGAQAILRPMPQIPDELREDAFNAVAVARFHIAADGTATFELARPTPNPRLNRLLLEKLREWRFFPAMRDGKPVPSDQDVRITFEVK